MREVPRLIDARPSRAASRLCHVALGISVTPDAAHRAGQPALCQPALYLAAQSGGTIWPLRLRAYRSGKRAHEVMGVLAQPLSDDHIAQLAAWFSVIRIKAHAPR